ncbi:hypothetical protein [Streptomyces sp. NPDC020681]|uniref:hypothetical protein n=1 Tax=Streptomyces sp. NPDC020681 TaxID=3365083 RepID=UPI0037AB4F44
MDGRCPARLDARPDSGQTEGIEALFEQYPQVKAKVDAGYRGLAKRLPDQVQAPPNWPAKDAPAEEHTAWAEARKQQSGGRSRTAARSASDISDG